jgi:hypothetical protein
LGDVFDANRRKFLEDFTRDEVVAREVLGKRLLMTVLISVCLNRWRGLRVCKGIPKDGLGVPPHQVS